MRVAKLALLVTLISGVLVACDSNPVDEEHGHEAVEGLSLTMGGVEIVVVEAGVVTGQISVESGQETPDIFVEWRDPDGEHFHEDDLEDHLTLGHLITGVTDIAEFEHHSDDPRFSFHIHGENVGTTTIELQLFNNDHIDFRTPSIPIVVN